MLVLSRQRDESIFIGDNIKISIVDVRGGKVRLGIEAPTEIPVHRGEVYGAIQAALQPGVVVELELTLPTETTPEVTPKKKKAPPASKKSSKKSSRRTRGDAGGQGLVR